MSFKKQLGVQLLIAFAAIAAALIATQLIASHLDASANAILEQKRNLALRIHATDQLASLKAASDKAQPLVAFLNSTLPPKDDLINFGQSLRQLAKNEGIDLGFSFGGEAPPKGNLPGYIPFSITGSGTYENFQKFLKDVESSRYFVKFNSFDLVREGDTNSFNLRADGQVFYQ